MSNPLLSASFNYAKLLKTIRQEIASAKIIIQKKQAETYWKVGKYISEYVLNGADRAEYGEGIYTKLSQDLKISVNSLERMVRFSREFSISAARQKLTWTQFRTILSLPDPSTREHFMKETEKNKWTTRQLQKEVASRKVLLLIPSDGKIPQLKVIRGELYTYSILEPSTLHPIEDQKLIDCGFDCLRAIAPAQIAKFQSGDIVESVKTDTGYKFKSSERTKKDLYVFKATIERIVDGDTILAVIDIGFDTWKRQYLRFRGINCPELSTKEGQSVKRFIESRMKPNDFVIIKTHKDDKYGRYLVDVWYAPPVKNEGGGWDDERIVKEGIYLNQELLDNRLAGLMK